MSTLLDERYVLERTPSGSGLLPAHDALLDRPVDVLILDAEPRSVPRARLLRQLRRATADGGPQVVPVSDSGSVNDRPFLVFPRRQALAELPALPVSRAVAAVLDALAGVQALRRVGLGPLALTPEHLRVGPDDVVQVLPAAKPATAAAGDGGGADGGGAAPPEDVHAAGSLLEALLARAGGRDERLGALAAHATGRARPAVPSLERFVAELQSWQAAQQREAHRRPAAARPDAARSEAGSRPEAGLRSDAGAGLRGSSGPSRVEAPVRRSEPLRPASRPGPPTRSGPHAEPSAGALEDRARWARDGRDVREARDARDARDAAPPPRRSGEAPAAPAYPVARPGPRVPQPEAAPVSRPAARYPGPPDERRSNEQDGGRGEQRESERDRRAATPRAEEGTAQGTPAPLYVPLASLLHDDDDEDPPAR